MIKVDNEYHIDNDEYVLSPGDPWEIFHTPCATTYRYANWIYYTGCEWTNDLSCLRCNKIVPKEVYDRASFIAGTK